MSSEPLDRPGAPEPPAGPATQSQGSTSVLERTQEEHAPGDEERYAHVTAMRRAEQDAKGWKPVEVRPRKVTTALKAYALLATSADKGAVRDRQLLDGV